MIHLSFQNNCFKCGKEFYSKYTLNRHLLYNCKVTEVAPVHNVFPKQEENEEPPPIIVEWKPQISNIIMKLDSRYEQWVMANESNVSVKGIYPLLFPDKLTEKYRLSEPVCAINQYEVLDEIVEKSKNNELLLPKKIKIKDGKGKIFEVSGDALIPHTSSQFGVEDIGNFFKIFYKNRLPNYVMDALKDSGSGNNNDHENNLIVAPAFYVPPQIPLPMVLNVPGPLQNPVPQPIPQLPALPLIPPLPQPPPLPQVPALPQILPLPQLPPLPQPAVNNLLNVAGLNFMNAPQLSNEECRLAYQNASDNIASYSSYYHFPERFSEYELFYLTGFSQQTFQQYLNNLTPPMNRVRFLTKDARLLAYLMRLRRGSTFRDGQADFHVTHKHLQTLFWEYALHQYRYDQMLNFRNTRALGCFITAEAILLQNAVHDDYTRALFEPILGPDKMLVQTIHYFRLE